MRVLVLGAGGMLGHKLMQRLPRRGFAVAGTVRSARPDPAMASSVPAAQLLTGVSAEDLGSVAAAMREFRPQAVLNCIGIIKQLDAAKNPIASITINSLFPHHLSALCEQHGARLVHFSTDCVFSGDSGPYTEDAVPDARDLYGRTKLLGEVSGPALTIRSSIIGHELREHRSLVDWFLSQNGGTIRGYANALYSGVTTPVMADLIARVLADGPELHGVWQVASEPVSKYDLLNMIRQVYQLDITVERDEGFRCDRRLDGSRFRAQMNWVAPPWLTMIKELCDDSRGYPMVTTWRRQGDRAEA